MSDPDLTVWEARRTRAMNDTTEPVRHEPGCECLEFGCTGFHRSHGCTCDCPRGDKEPPSVMSGNEYSVNLDGDPE